MAKKPNPSVFNNRLASVIAYSLVGVIVIAFIVQWCIIYTPFGGPAFVRQSFRPSPSSTWLGISDFYPTTSLEASAGLFDNYQERIINNGVSFLMIHLPHKNKADMKLTIKNTAPVGALFTIADTTGDTYFRIVGEDELHTKLLTSEQYTVIHDPQTNIVLFQRVGAKLQFESVADFFTNAPTDTVGLYYPPTDQLRFSKAQELTTTILHGTVALNTLGLSELPNYILSSQAEVLAEDASYTSYGLNWNLEKIPIADYSRYTFNVLPRTSEAITIKPIIIKLY